MWDLLLVWISVEGFLEGGEAANRSLYKRSYACCLGLLFSFPHVVLHWITPLIASCLTAFNPRSSRMTCLYFLFLFCPVHSHLILDPTTITNIASPTSMSSSYSAPPATSP